MDKAIRAAEGEVVLCGLPALILKFLDPEILKGSGFRTVDELRSSPSWEGRLAVALDLAKQRFPRLRVVVVDREGSVLGDSG
jgi:cobalt-precorrin-5B (C1)-methyltransferase